MRRLIMLTLIPACLLAVSGCAATDELHSASKLKDAVVYAKDVAVPMSRYADAITEATPDGSITPAEAARLQLAANKLVAIAATLRTVSPPDRLDAAHLQLVRGITRAGRALQLMSVAALHHRPRAYQTALRNYSASQTIIGAAVQTIVTDSGIPIDVGSTATATVRP